MKRAVLLLSVLLLVVVGVGIVQQSRGGGSRPVIGRPGGITLVVEWDVAPASEANVPKLSKSELVAKIKNWRAAFEAFGSWEAAYRLRWRQAAWKENNVPEMTDEWWIRIVSNGNRWLYESQDESKDKTKGQNHSVVVSNGEVVKSVWPSKRQGQVQNAESYPGPANVPTIGAFLPGLPGESVLARGGWDFPEVAGIIGGADTELLDWYTLVGGHACYVLERTTTREQPIFRSREEADKWFRENPQETTREGQTIDVDPDAKAGDVRITRTKVRVAVDPEFGFAIVRWAHGLESERGQFKGTVFPDREIIYGDFREVKEGLYVAREMEMVRYTADREGRRRLLNATRLEVEKLVVNAEYEDGLFEFDFPEGYRLFDRIKWISYRVGASKEEIDVLAGAAKARDAFYKKLGEGQAPTLDGSSWINSEPMSLDKYKGRKVVVHFWSLGCAPCVSELPWLQEQYGQGGKSGFGPVFVSIHPFVDGDDLKELKKKIKKQGITFPVMVDSRDTEGRSWGKTFKKYRVFAVPSKVNIGANGHFSGIDEEYISASSWWVGHNKDRMKK